ncbi:MAG: glycosyltransferase, partial [Pseudomonadota bacterium]
ALAAELPPGIAFLYVHFLHTPGSVTRYAAVMRGIGWGVSAHAKDIWTTPEREVADKLADARFAVTCTATGAAYLRDLADRPETVALAYHGLDLREFPPPPDRLAAGKGPVTFLSVGRLVEKKGYDDLLGALARLPKDLEWRFVHIGGGKLTKPLMAQAARLGLSGRIDWRGKQDRAAVIEAMRAADLFVLPSKIAADGDRDGLPNVLMEAASQKLATIATRAAAIPEFLREGREGLLVPPGDPDALAEALATLAQDPAQRQSLGAAASARLTAEFGMEAGIALIAERLREALEEQTVRHPQDRAAA